MRDNLTNIIIIGYPRSGNTWLGRLLADALGCGYLYSDRDRPDFTGESSDGLYLIHKSHGNHKPDAMHTVLIIRDPRDVAVSVAHYLFGGDVLRAIDAMTKPIGLWGVPSYLGFMEAWWYLRPVLCVARYEYLHSRPLSILGEICTFIMGYSPTNAALALTVNRQSFEAVRRRYPPTNGMRNGRTGEWREAFTAEAAHEFDRHFGKLLIDQNYEPDRAWLNHYAG